MFGVEGIAVCWIVFVRESCVDFVRESCFPFVFWWEERPKNEREREERGKIIIFYSTGDYFNWGKCLELLQWLLQYSPCLESYCSKSKKKLELPSLLECLFCVNSVCCSPKFGFTESIGDAIGDAFRYHDGQYNYNGTLLA